VRRKIAPAALTALVTFAAVCCNAAPDLQQTITRIAFGSCARQDRPQPVWDAINEFRPQLFLFIGDNIYADTEDMNVMRAKYEMLGAIPGFRRLRESCTLMAVWDDHDYGANDAGAEYPKKVESQQEFRRFFGPPFDPSREGKPGVYDAAIFGPEGRRVQVILPDTRYFRSPLFRKPKSDTSPGPYGPNLDPAATLLGEEQWQWLEEQLKKPAEIRLIASSIQVVPEDHGWEKWMNFPHERDRLFELIRKTGAAGVIFLTGDRHLAELSMMDGGVGYPLFDLTSSSLNASSLRWRPLEVNRHRVGTMAWGDNFGTVLIDWNRDDPLITLQIREVDGEVAISRRIPLSVLQPGTIK